MEEALAIRLGRLRGRGSAYLGRLRGTELFLPWLDWLLTAVVMTLLYWGLTYFDRELRRQDLLVMIGYLGVAVMIQAMLYVLGSALAALVCRLRIASLQLGPARRTGRFVTYADRGRAFTLFYPLRSVPALLAWRACDAAFAAGASPLLAVIGQICALSVAFALLPIPGSDGHRFLQSLVLWLTGSVHRAALWGSLAAAALAGLGCWYCLDRLNQPLARGDGFIYMIAGFYLLLGVFSHLGAVGAAKRYRGLDRISVEQLARPVALAMPGNRRAQFPAGSIVAVSDGAQLLGVVDDSTVGTDPVEEHLLPCPAAPVLIDPLAPFPEAFLGMFDEGCDAVVLQSGAGYACLTLEDCGVELARHNLPYDNHLNLG